MTPHDLYLEAKRLGLELRVVVNKLAVTPGDRCPATLAEALRAHKDAMIEWLNRSPCPGWQAVPPNDLPLHPIQPRPPMVEARKIVEFVVRQIGDLPGPLCEWCLKRELRYWEAYRWPHQACAYAAARDAVCWQLSRSAEDVWEFLAATEAALTNLPHSSTGPQTSTGAGGSDGPAHCPGLR
jgi:hypothetical protein